jgi:hypothetical protein
MGYREGNRRCRVRKVLMVLAMAAVGLLLVAPAVDAKERLRAVSERRRQGEIATYMGSASCPVVYLYSSPRMGMALRPQRMRVQSRTFKFRRPVLVNAAIRRHLVVARCNNRYGRLIGRVSLTVLPKKRLAETGAPVLPKLLLGTGLVGASGTLLLVGRRRGSPNVQLSALESHMGPVALPPGGDRPRV